MALGRRRYGPDEIDQLIDDSEPFGRTYLQGMPTVERVQGIIEHYNALGVAIEEEFVNDRTPADGDDDYTTCLVRLVHEVGRAVRRVENALESTEYRCPECDGEADAQVLDGKVGAVFVETSCNCEGVDDRISAAALERWRLGQIMSGEAVA